MWSDKTTLENRSVRYLDSALGQFASINILVPANSNYPGNYSLLIEYKDTTEFNIEVDIYDGLVYQNIGNIVGAGDNIWKNKKLYFPSTFLRKREATDSYNLLHARQLSILYKLTDNIMFLNYSDLFYDYSK